MKITKGTNSLASNIDCINRALRRKSERIILGSNKEKDKPGLLPKNR